MDRTYMSDMSDLSDPDDSLAAMRNGGHGASKPLFGDRPVSSTAPSDVMVDPYEVPLISVPKALRMGTDDLHFSANWLQRWV